MAEAFLTAAETLLFELRMLYGVESPWNEDRWDKPGSN